jgi:hypothetical protein
MAPLRICQRVVERHRHQVGRITAAEANHLVGDDPDPTVRILSVQRDQGVAEGGGVPLVLR